MADPTKDLLGNGLIAPLQRLAGVDFVSAAGEELVRSAIRQILMTDPGELPWRPSFGGGLSRFRHQNLTEDVVSQVQAQVFAAIADFEPRVRVTQVDVEAVKEQLHVVVHWLILAPGGNQTDVLVGPTTAEVLI